MQKTYSKFLFILLLFFVFIPFISVRGQQEVPKDMNEAKGAFQTILEAIPRAISNLFSQIKAFFDRYVYSYLKGIWNRIYYYLGKKVEERKPSVQKEFNREVNELKTEAVQKAPSLWQTILNFIH